MRNLFATDRDPSQAARGPRPGAVLRRRALHHQPQRHPVADGLRRRGRHQDGPPLPRYLHRQGAGHGHQEREDALQGQERRGEFVSSRRLRGINLLEAWPNRLSANDAMINEEIKPPSFQLLEVYDCTREELRIGPFSYDPMRAVDLFLQQTDEFLINSFSSVSEVRDYYRLGI